MAASLKKARLGRSVRRSVVVTLVVSFAIIFTLVCLMVSFGMYAMLDNREKDYMYGQAEMACNVLMLSVGHIPGLAREWASMRSTYDFVTGMNNFAYYTHFMPGHYYGLNKVNLLAVIDANGDVLFEKYYLYRDQTEEAMPSDLGGIYKKLADICAVNYEAAVGEDNMAAAGVSGFLGREGNVYYLSAYPVAGEIPGETPVGTLVFGQMIDDEELGAMEKDIGVDFSVMDIDGVAFTQKELDVLEKDRHVLIIDGGAGEAFHSFDDIFGDNTLMVSVQDGRELYSRGLLLIAAVVMLAALGCVLLMLFVLNLLDNIILRPLTNLVGELNGINHFAGGRRVTVDNSNQEMSNLTNAINSMLAHIEEEQDIIKNKNESLYKSACMDALTGLSNRMNATDELEESIRIAKEGGYHVTAYHMDIDRFKFVNDTIGHKMGNELMKLIAARLSERFGEGDIIARMNGDEFMVCVDNLESKADARACAVEIMGVFKDPLWWGGRSI
jgi:GGDEF domain-containing protein/sensor domain CHASE-containing protein